MRVIRQADVERVFAGRELDIIEVIADAYGRFDEVDALSRIRCSCASPGTPATASSACRSSSAAITQRPE